MKVIDAVWEMRNLGKKTIEIKLEDEDFAKSPKEICNLIDQIKSQYHSEYTVIKIRSGNPCIGNEIIKHGFVQMEMQFHIKATKSDIEIATKKYANFFKHTKMEEAKDKDSQEYIFNEIRKGIFFTDRIALDPQFGIEIANNRYANWAEDEVKRNSSLDYIIVDDEKIGFTLRRYDKTAAYSLLAGLFNDYKNLNIGGSVFFTELREDIKRGYRVFYTDVSSNNLVSLKLREAFGYKIDGLYEVYIKHDEY